MDEIAFCRKVYQEFVAAQELPGDLKRALRSHERVPMFIDNLARELKGIDSNVKKETLEATVKDMTKFFIGAVARQCTERVMSDISKSMIVAKEESKIEFRREADALEAKGADYVTSEQGLETIHTVAKID